MPKKEEMYARIARHGENLKDVFGLPADTDAIALCKKLRTLEGKAYHAATLWCNGLTTEDYAKEIFESTRRKVVEILGDRYPVHINSDPRGYALKIDDEVVRQNNLVIYRDWGGYGILAPDLTEN